MPARGRLSRTAARARCRPHYSDAKQVVGLGCRGNRFASACKHKRPTGGLGHGGRRRAFGVRECMLCGDPYIAPRVRLAKHISFSWIFYKVGYSKSGAGEGVTFDILLRPDLVLLTYSYGGLLICIRNIHFSLFALVWQAVMFCL